MVHELGPGVPTFPVPTAQGAYEILMLKIGCGLSRTFFLIVLTVPLNCLRQIASLRSLCYFNFVLLTTLEVF